MWGRRMRDIFKQENRRNAERGASLVQYALLVALIGVVALAAIRGTGEKITQQTLYTSCAVTCGACGGYYVTTTSQNGCKGWAAGCMKQAKPHSCMNWLIKKWCNAACKPPTP